MGEFPLKEVNAVQDSGVEVDSEGTVRGNRICRCNPLSSSSFRASTFRRPHRSLEGIYDKEFIQIYRDIDGSMFDDQRPALDI